MRNYFSSMSLYIYVINYIFYLAGSSDVTRICTGNSDMSSKSIGVIFVTEQFLFSVLICSLAWYMRSVGLLCGNIVEKLDPWITNPLGPPSARAVSWVYDTSIVIDEDKGRTMILRTQTCAKLSNNKSISRFVIFSFGLWKRGLKKAVFPVFIF